MLSPRHEGQTAAGFKLRDTEPTPHDVLAGLRELRQPMRTATVESDLLRDRASAFAVAEFARRYMRVRDDLAWRAGGGESLDEIERAALHALDAILDELERPAPQLSPEAERIMRDVRNRIGRVG